MGDVQGAFLGPPHCTTPAAVIANKNIKVNSFKSSENIHEKEILIKVLHIYSLPGHFRRRNLDY